MALQVTDERIGSTGRAKPDLEKVQAYDNAEVVERLTRKLKLTLDEAEQLFADVKLFLCLAATTGKSLVPSDKIDAGWHEFLLYTSEYRAFCSEHLGKFVHHCPPSYFDDDRNPSQADFLETMNLAAEMLGTLSSNWDVTTSNAAKCSDNCSTSH